MWPYWTLFFVPTWMALSQSRVHVNAYFRQHWTAQWKLVFIALSCMIGLRYEVGGDWLIYIDNMNELKGVAFSGISFNDDPAFTFIKWFGANVFGGIYLVNLVSAAVFSWGLISFCRAQPRPWLALVVAIPYLVTMVAMGYTRQAVAIGISMVALLILMQGKVSRFVVMVAVAMTFHKSAAILLPLSLLGKRRVRVFPVIALSCVGIILFYLLVSERFAFLVHGYLEDKYESSGAWVRVAMCVLPALIFLKYKGEFLITTLEQRIWVALSYASIGFMLLLFVSPSSTAVDRLALYCLPLQLFVYSRLPGVVGRSVLGCQFWVIFLLVYSFIVYFVWLFYADFSWAWLPYKFMPIEWLWQT